MGVSKTTVHHWIVEWTLHVHSNSLRPILTEENRLPRFEMDMDSRDPVHQTKYQDMHHGDNDYNIDHIGKEQLE